MNQLLMLLLKLPQLGSEKPVHDRPMQWFGNHRRRQRIHQLKVHTLEESHSMEGLDQATICKKTFKITFILNLKFI